MQIQVRVLQKPSIFRVLYSNIYTIFYVLGEEDK